MKKSISTDIEKIRFFAKYGVSLCHFRTKHDVYAKEEIVTRRKSQAIVFRSLGMSLTAGERSQLASCTGKRRRSAKDAGPSIVGRTISHGD